MKFDAFQRKAVTEKLQSLWDGFSDSGRVDFYLSQLERFPFRTAILALERVAASQEITRRPTVFAISQVCVELSPKDAPVGHQPNVERKGFSEWLDDAIAGLIEVNENQRRAIQWLTEKRQQKAGKVPF